MIAKFRPISLIWLMALLIGACSTSRQSELPRLELPWKISHFKDSKRENHQKGREGEWLYHVKLAMKLQSEAQERLDRSTLTIYQSIVDRNQDIWSLLALPPSPQGMTVDYRLNRQDFAKYATVWPALPVDADLQRQIVAGAVQQHLFLDYKLTQSQQQDINKSWPELLRADYYLLYCGVIVAELQQKWPQALKKMPTDQANHYRRLGELLTKLPTIQAIEKNRLAIFTLQEGYRQLIRRNDGLRPPAWEIILEEDIARDIIHFQR